MLELTSKARVLTTFNHQETDRVPVWLGASPGFREKAIHYLGLADDESLSRYVGDDFRRVYSRFAGPPEVSPYTDLPAGATFRSPFGILRHGYEGGQPMSHPLQNATLDEIHGYSWPKPEWVDISHIAEEAQQFGKQYAILGGEWSPFWHDAIDLMGMDSLMLTMYDEPEKVDALLTHIVDYYEAISRRTFEAAADAIDIFFIGNDFGSQNGPLLSEGLFRRFLVPPLRRLVDLGHEYSLKVLLHCCGGFEPLIPSMIEIGVDGLQGLQPRCRGMEPSALKAKYGRELVLMGAIDSQLIIERSPEAVDAETRRILDIMMPDGGYIACPSHDYVLVETPVENVLTLYETVREVGKYR